jgi:hypothetical protein
VGRPCPLQPTGSDYDVPQNRHVVSAVVSVGGSEPAYGAKVLLLVLVAHHVDHPTCRTLQPHEIPAAGERV